MKRVSDFSVESFEQYGGGFIVYYAGGAGLGAHVMDKSCLAT
jgi:hypothetical protein